MNPLPLPLLGYEQVPAGNASHMGLEPFRRTRLIGQHNESRIGFEETLFLIRYNAGRITQPGHIHIVLHHILGYDQII